MTPPPGFQQLTLRAPAPARVLALGAWLKNTAVLIDGALAWVSPVHGDLSTPQACAALDASVRTLLALARSQAGDTSAGHSSPTSPSDLVAPAPIDVIAHDLHPDFYSTQLAQAWADSLGVPALGIQHHHAHLAAVAAEHGWSLSADDPAPIPLIGLAFDGVGLGTDHTAWGGELLRIDRQQTHIRADAKVHPDTDAATSADTAPPAFQRLAHLPALRMAGGDVAAREPWRLAVDVLRQLGACDQITARFGRSIGDTRLRLLLQMLDRQLNCPQSTAAGRWFDAVAALLGLSLVQSEEAEAAIALERCATAWWARHDNAEALLHQALAQVDKPSEQAQPLRCMDPNHGAPTSVARAIAPAAATDTLPLLTVIRHLLTLDPSHPDQQGFGAALFHEALAQLSAHAAATHHPTPTRGPTLDPTSNINPDHRPANAPGHRATPPRPVLASGGCFFNRLLTQRLRHHLACHGLQLQLPTQLSCGDAGLALGQAWAAAFEASHRAQPIPALRIAEHPPCTATVAITRSTTCAAALEL